MKLSVSRAILDLRNPSSELLESILAEDKLFLLDHLVSEFEAKIKEENKQFKAELAAELKKSEQSVSPAKHLVASFLSYWTINIYTVRQDISLKAHDAVDHVSRWDVGASNEYIQMYSDGYNRITRAIGKHFSDGSNDPNDRIKYFQKRRQEISAWYAEGHSAEVPISTAIKGSSPLNGKHASWQAFIDALDIPQEYSRFSPWSGYEWNAILYDFREEIGCCFTSTPTVAEPAMKEYARRLSSFKLRTLKDFEKFGKNIYQLSVLYELARIIQEEKSKECRKKAYFYAYNKLPHYLKVPEVFRTIEAKIWVHFEPKNGREFSFDRLEGVKNPLLEILYSIVLSNL